MNRHQLDGRGVGRLLADFGHQLPTFPPAEPPAPGPGPTFARPTASPTVTQMASPSPEPETTATATGKPGMPGGRIWLPLVLRDGLLAEPLP